MPICSLKPRANGRNNIGQQLPNCWMLHVASVCTAVGNCCERVVAQSLQTGQTFEPTTPNISFVPWSPKRSATILDQFAQLFQHCWGHASALHMVFLQSQIGCIPSTVHCRSQYCWELLHPFAHHCQHGRNNSQNCWPNNFGSCCT